MGDNWLMNLNVNSSSFRKHTSSESLEPLDLTCKERKYQRCAENKKKMGSYEIRRKKTFPKYANFNEKKPPRIKPTSMHKTINNKIEQCCSKSKKILETEFKVPHIPQFTRSGSSKLRGSSSSHYSNSGVKKEKLSKYSKYSKRLTNARFKKENNIIINTHQRDTKNVVYPAFPLAYGFYIPETKKHPDFNYFERQFNYLHSPFLFSFDHNRKMNNFNPWLIPIYNSMATYTPFINKPHGIYQNVTDLMKPLSIEIPNFDYELQEQIYKEPIIPIQNKILIKNSQGDKSFSKTDSEFPYSVGQMECYCKDCEQFVRNALVKPRESSFDIAVPCQNINLERKKSRKNTPKKTMTKEETEKISSKNLDAAQNLDTNYLITFKEPQIFPEINSIEIAENNVNLLQASNGNEKVVAIDCDGNLVTNKEISVKGESVDKGYCQEILITTYNIQDNRTYCHLPSQINAFNESKINFQNQQEDSNLCGPSNSPEIDILTVD